MSIDMDTIASLAEDNKFNLLTNPVPFVPNTEHVLRCHGSCDSKYTNIFVPMSNDLPFLKSITFMGNNMKTITEVLDTCPSQSIERFTYFSNPAKPQSVLTSDQLGQILNHRALNLIALSLNYRGFDMSQKALDYIRNVDNVFPNLKHLRLTGLTPKQLETIFIGNKFKKLESLIILDANGQMKMSHFNSIKHLKLKRFLICGCTIESSVFGEMNRCNWFNSATHVHLNMLNRLTTQEIKSIMDALPATLEELVFNCEIPKMSSESTRLFVEYSNKFNKLKKLYANPFQFNIEQVKQIHTSIKKSNQNAVLVISADTLLEKTIKEHGLNDIYTVTQICSILGRGFTFTMHPFRTQICDEFAEERGETRGMSQNRGFNWKALLINLFLMILISYYGPIIACIKGALDKFY